jgi:mono/diheme cytochrome c family protein
MPYALTPLQKRTLTTILIILAVFAGFAAWFAWYKFFRVVPEAEWQAANGHSADDRRFMYGSIGAEQDAGIPYWIVYVLPRVFPDKLPKPGTGFSAFGLGWEEGEELPIGFTKKTIGFERLANNCAACHTASLRSRAGQSPVHYPTGPNHTFNLEAFFRFLVDCAKDSRFNSTRLMAEINLSADLSLVDRMIYRFILIPVTRMRLLERQEQFRWIYQHGPDWPDWGRGRDDAMNLTKYFLTGSKMDSTLGPTDMPSVWNLQKYDPKRNRLNLAGDSWDAHSVIIDSALGLLGAAPGSNQVFLDEIAWLEKYLGSYPAPKYPYPIVAEQAAAGSAVFTRECARCHRSARTGTVLPVAEVGTDVNRMLSWNREAAIKSNVAVERFGIKRRGLVEEDPTGYIVPYLDGIWLRGPYLHNGSVPTLRDLLSPLAARPKLFYRGYDLYDPLNVGFVSQGAEAMRIGTVYDVTRRSNGNQGHEFGVALPQAEKDALIEYLKTL